uniref:Uncharacterized protein n=1 Tax=Syphacia muris TaxID=451379 RepID=A0A0N5AK09_9BILA
MEKLNKDQFEWTLISRVWKGTGNVYGNEIVDCFREDQIGEELERAVQNSNDDRLKYKESNETKNVLLIITWIKGREEEEEEEEGAKRRRE